MRKGSNQIIYRNRRLEVIGNSSDPLVQHAIRSDIRLNWMRFLLVAALVILAFLNSSGYGILYAIWKQICLTQIP